MPQTAEKSLHNTNYGLRREINLRWRPWRSLTSVERRNTAVRAVSRKHSVVILRQYPRSRSQDSPEYTRSTSKHIPANRDQSP